MAKTPKVQHAALALSKNLTRLGSARRPPCGAQATYGAADKATHCDT